MKSARLLILAGVSAAVAGLLLLPGCTTNRHPMRFNPEAAGSISPGRSWFIQGSATNGAPISCSFVEFDERGDFMDFDQHTDCEHQIRELVNTGRVLLLIYCHGWKNSSQSGDVVKFASFLTRLASNPEIQKRGLRVHGVYLGWRGNPVLPYVDRSSDNESYGETVAAFHGPVVDSAYERRFYWLGAVPETLSYYTRKRAAEHLVSGLPMARAIFTYASAAKDYGRKLDNRVCVMGHSFGALMLERSLGQAMTGALTMEWWEHQRQQAQALEQPSLPFDMVFFVNSAAPAIYAKEMRDFLSAHRVALSINHHPARDVPVIVSLTSTADWATGIVHPIGNSLSPLAPSLQRRYTKGIFGTSEHGEYPTHRGIQQSRFYTTTPGHQPLLINHWIVKESPALLPPDTSPAAVFTANLSTTNTDSNVFFTSPDKYPAAVWRLTNKSPGEPVTMDGLPLSMQNSDYWIVTCGKELIGGHNDVWSRTAMEMYAGLFRAVESRLKSHR